MKMKRIISHRKRCNVDARNTDIRLNKARVPPTYVGRPPLVARRQSRLKPQQGQQRIVQSSTHRQRARPTETERERGKEGET